MSEGFKGLQSSGPVLFPFSLCIIFLLGGEVWNAMLDLLNEIFYASDILTIGEHLKELLWCTWRKDYSFFTFGQTRG